MKVVELSTEIAGPYCGKLLADTGAEVVKVEPPGGDPLRSWRSGGLFEYLNSSKRLLEGDPLDYLEGARVVITDRPDDVPGLRALDPRLVVTTISPFGADGPWAGRPATELTLQASAGSMGSRGLPEDPPLPAGGRVGEWVSGTYAAVATLAATWSDQGRHVDVSMLDCMAIALVTFPSVFSSFAGWPVLKGTGRTIEVPSIEPTSDGWVVFTTNSAQQFHDFLILIGRPDLLEDKGLARAPQRFNRRAEFLEEVHKYTRSKSSAQVLEEAAMLRIPAGPVLNGQTVTEFEQFKARQVFVASSSGRFRQPRRPWNMTPDPHPAAIASPEGGLPLEGVRIIDCTAWWAGPSATQILACLGADVIKVESVKRPDLMRLASVKPPADGAWWEWGALFHGVNTSKRDVTIDLTRPEGVDLFERLARSADAVVENYTPRVMDHFGLGWERLHDINPRLVMVRMPAFGLDGPWRDRTGFAQTMECISGMAWVTGHPDGPPVLPRGPCDPLAGLHAAVAALVALQSSRADGKGRLVEATMVEAALNVAAEQVIEWDLSGDLLARNGSRDGAGRPQGVYRCAGEDRWVAIAVTSDEQFAALCREASFALGADRLTVDLDQFDAAIGNWCSNLDADEVAELLSKVGVPAASVVSGRDILHNPQLRHRCLFEVEDHPVTGRHEVPVMPFRYSDVDHWMSRPSPSLGEHNDEVLGEVASTEELARLEAAGIIGRSLA